MRQRVGQKRLLLEKRRKRQTFWLSEDDIRVIEKLHEATGMPKYEVVSAAIQAMYKAILGAKESR